GCPFETTAPASPGATGGACSAVSSGAPPRLREPVSASTSSTRWHAPMADAWISRPRRARAARSRSCCHGFPRPAKAAPPCPKTMPDTVLLVEDEPALARGLVDNLRDAGYDVRLVRRGDAAVAAVRELKPDIVVLDIMLPGRSGLDVLRDLRDAGIPVPVL